VLEYLETTDGIPAANFLLLENEGCYLRWYDDLQVDCQVQLYRSMYHL